MSRPQAALIGALLGAIVLGLWMLVYNTSASGKPGTLIDKTAIPFYLLGGAVIGGLLLGLFGSPPGSD